MNTVPPIAAPCAPASRNIALCPDGKYRWNHEINLLRHPAFFLMVWKIFFFILIGIFLFTMIIDIGNADYWWDGLLMSLRFFGYILIGMTALVVIGYLVYAAIMGGKYRVTFEMDDQGVNHKQVAQQAKKAKKIAALTMMAGAAAGKPTAAGIGMTAANTEMYTEFARVKAIRRYPRRGLIKLREGLSRNEVYAAKEDYAFVESYICSRCPGAKIK